MDRPRPVLLVTVPADWEVVPDALAELRRCLSDEYGAVLSLRWAVRPLRAPRWHFCGWWDQTSQAFAQRDVRPRVQAAFTDLSWLDEAG